MHALLYLKWIADKDLRYSTGNSIQCFAAAWMGGVFGWKWIHVYHGWVPLLSTWNHHNNVNWLYCNTKWKIKKKKKKKSRANFFSGTISFKPQNNSYKTNIIIILISKLENWGSRRTVIWTGLIQGINLSTVLPF